MQAINTNTAQLFRSRFSGLTGNMHKYSPVFLTMRSFWVYCEYSSWFLPLCFGEHVWALSPHFFEFFDLKFQVSRAWVYQNTQQNFAPPPKVSTEYFCMFPNNSSTNYFFHFLPFVLKGYTGSTIFVQEPMLVHPQFVWVQSRFSSVFGSETEFLRD